VAAEIAGDHGVAVGGGFGGAADCGSCTSCSTHDLNDLDRKGVTGVSVLTTEFEQAFHSQKSAIGLDAASVYVSHPLQNKTTQELHASADKAVEEILHAIRASGETKALKGVA
jgi:hypothetical protein